MTFWKPWLVAKRPEVAIVTCDPFALALANQYGFEMIVDHTNTGETDAITIATQVCQMGGVDNTLVIPADIPLLQVLELEKMLEAAPGEGSVLGCRQATAEVQRGLPPPPGSISACRFGTTVSNRTWPPPKQLASRALCFHYQHRCRRRQSFRSETTR